MCIFCKIINNEIPSKKVLENSEFLAFEDVNPQAPIHILIIPKAHYESFETTPSEVISKISEFIKEVSKKIEVDKNGYRLVTNIGENGGQEVKHLHFHLIAGAKLKWGNFI